MVTKNLFTKSNIMFGIACFLWFIFMVTFFYLALDKISKALNGSVNSEFKNFVDEKVSTKLKTHFRNIGKTTKPDYSGYSVLNIRRLVSEGKNTKIRVNFLEETNSMGIDFIERFLSSLFSVKNNSFFTKTSVFIKDFITFDQKIQSNDSFFQENQFKKIFYLPDPKISLIHRLGNQFKNNDYSRYNKIIDMIFDIMDKKYQEPSTEELTHSVWVLADQRTFRILSLKNNPESNNLILKAQNLMYYRYLPLSIIPTQVIAIMHYQNVLRNESS